MAYGIIPDMTDEKVVCQKPCEHIDCKEMREDFISNNKCRVCKEELKAGQPFCYEPEFSKYTKSHWHCLV